MCTIWLGIKITSRKHITKHEKQQHRKQRNEKNLHLQDSTEEILKVVIQISIAVNCRLFSKNFLKCLHCMKLFEMLIAQLIGVYNIYLVVPCGLYSRVTHVQCKLREIIDWLEKNKKNTNGSFNLWKEKALKKQLLVELHVFVQVSNTVQKRNFSFLHQSNTGELKEGES